MTAQSLSAHGADRGVAFYLTALTYGNHLWQRGLAARALLSLDRAFSADLRGDESELGAWPLPYDAMAWFLHHTPEGVFIGNPRVHFQHLADRMNEPRREQRRWRAWAGWSLARVVLPHLPPDPKHRVVEPSVEAIEHNLRRHGIGNEAALWRAALARAERRTGGAAD